MDHIMISHDKLKLMLSDAELSHYQLNIEELDSESALSRQTFRRLLEDVKHMAGFDAADDKVFIQLYPSRDGGAEIYITRLTHREEPQHADAAIRINTVCAFERMADLLAACRHAQRMPPDGSSAWQDARRYYLVMEDDIACSDYLHAARPDEKRGFIGEYGKIIADPTAIYYIKEHCFCFCEKNAVKILGSMV